MEAYKFDIKLQEAKRAIALPDFKRDDLLTIALTDPSDLNHLKIPKTDREHLESVYRRLAFFGDALFDSVLADDLFQMNQDLTKSELDWWRQTTASKESFAEFAIKLGLPRYCSS